ncbi:DNA cytosine methyltransferase [Streptomyces mobaraensis]
MEQSSNLPERVLDELSTEFLGAEWFRTFWAVLKSADLGVASRRKRVFVIAARHMAAGNAAPSRPTWPTARRQGAVHPRESCPAHPPAIPPCAGPDDGA